MKSTTPSELRRQLAEALQERNSLRGEVQRLRAVDSAVRRFLRQYPLPTDPVRLAWADETGLLVNLFVLRELHEAVQAASAEKARQENDGGT